MNSLSWFIYLAGLFDSLNHVTTFLSITSLLALGVLVFVALPMSDCNAGESAWAIWKKIGKCLLPICIISGTINTVLPTKETMYAIAASEMGEKVMHTQTFNKATQALNAWLDKQISPTTTNESDKK